VTPDYNNESFMDLNYAIKKPKLAKAFRTYSQDQNIHFLFP